MIATRENLMGWEGQRGARPARFPRVADVPVASCNGLESYGPEQRRTDNRQ